MPRLSNVPDFDALTDEPTPLARPVDLWRQGHRRPWWQWNVLTLFASLFILIWARELAGISQEATWLLCIAALGLWFLYPLAVKEFLLKKYRAIIRASAFIASLILLGVVMNKASVFIGGCSLLAVAMMALAVRSWRESSRGR